MLGMTDKKRSEAELKELDAKNRITEEMLSVSENFSVIDVICLLIVYFSSSL